MSYVTRQLAGAVHRIGRTPQIAYPYELKTVYGRWIVTKEQHTPVIYIVQAENRLLKIGRASNVVKRIAAIDRASPIPVELFHLILTNNVYALERELHELFADYWVRGEWFDLDEEGRQFVLAMDYVHNETDRLPKDYEWHAREYGGVCMAIGGSK
jgi:hypothetical protein